MIFRKKKQGSNQQPSVRRSSGGSGPQVFSYYARGSSATGQNTGRSAEREEQVVDKRTPKLHLGSISSLIALVVMVGILLYSLWIQPQPKVVVLAQPGTIHQDTASYQKAINAAWGSRIENQFKLSVDARSLEEQIARAVPDVGDVRVELPLLGRKATVVLTPGRPALELTTTNGAFYVDQNGKVMARSSEVKQNQLKDVPTVQDESAVETEVGKTVLTIQQATFIQALAKQLSAQGLGVQSMTLPANAANQVDVRLNGLNYYIKFATTGDARQGVGTFMAAKNKFENERVTPAEYVDVRIDEKVFYK